MSLPIDYNRMGSALRNGLPQPWWKQLLTTGVGAVPIVGGLASTALQFILNRADQAHTNKYNSPRETVKRLQKAGMPAAAYFSGGGNQSDITRPTNVELGTASQNAVENYFQNKMTKAQIELMAQRERGAEYAADLQKGKNEFYLGQQGYGLTGLQRLMSLDLHAKAVRANMDYWKMNMANLQYDIAKQLSDEGVQVKQAKGNLALTGQKVSESKARQIVYSTSVQKMLSDMAVNAARINNIKAGTSLMEQQKFIRQYEAAFNNTLYTTLLRGGYRNWEPTAVLGIHKRLILSGK